MIYASIPIVFQTAGMLTGKESNTILYHMSYNILAGLEDIRDKLLFLLEEHANTDGQYVTFGQIINHFTNLINSMNNLIKLLTERSESADITVPRDDLTVEETKYLNGFHKKLYRIPPHERIYFLDEFLDPFNRIMMYTFDLSHFYKIAKMDGSLHNY
jgi:hypothetical protein